MERVESFEDFILYLKEKDKRLSSLIANKSAKEICQLKMLIEEERRLCRNDFEAFNVVVNYLNDKNSMVHRTDDNTLNESKKRMVKKVISKGDKIIGQIVTSLFFLAYLLSAFSVPKIWVLVCTLSYISIFFSANIYRNYLENKKRTALLYSLVLLSLFALFITFGR